MILIETGLRSIDCLRLRYDPITTDEAGAPYLVFFDHKLSREAIIPISESLLAQIRRQQEDLAERFAKPPSVLLPRVRANPDGEIPRSAGERSAGDWTDGWPIARSGMRPANGCGSPRISSGHTVGTRMDNNKVPIDTIQQMLDHSRPAMTAIYATIKHQTLREEFDRSAGGHAGGAPPAPLPTTGYERTCWP